MSPFEPPAWYSIPVHNTLSLHAWWLIPSTALSPPVPAQLAWPIGFTA